MVGRGEARAARRAAARRLGNLVFEVAVELFEGRVVEEPIEGYQLLTRRRLADPLAGVRAAHLLQNVAGRELAEHVDAARAAGRSWEQIGEALNLPVGEGEEPRGEAAFALIVEGRRPERTQGLYREPCTSWRCSSCGELVRDRGPFESHPADNEPGHAESCARYRADIAAWRERTGWDD